MFGHQNDQQNQHDDDNDSQVPDHILNSPINNDVRPPLPTGDSPPADTITPTGATDSPAPVTPTVVSVSSSPAHTDHTTVDTNGLLDLKQQALGQLSPLVGHLEQTPEEKFRTTMMMIQASDNQALIKDAYAAAQQITDEKSRAQALLDVINEINYFTQHHEN